MDDTHKKLEVDETLNPEHELLPGISEIKFLGELLGGVDNIEDVFKKMQNRLLRNTMSIATSIDPADVQTRIENRVRYNFYNDIRTSINEYKKNKKVKR